MAKHAFLSPSSAHRWASCPGSVRRIHKMSEEGALVDMAGWHAAEGTAFHTLMERVLKTGRPPEAFAGQSVEVEFHDGEKVVSESFAFDDDMIDHARRARALVDDMRLLGAKLWFEQRVSMEPVVPECYGTADVVALFPDRSITVLDWKYGAGVPVDSEDNPQLLLYAFGVLNTLAEDTPDDALVEMAIYQPRVRSAESSWTLPAGEVRKRAKALGEKARIALRENAPVSPSEEACRWCPLAKANACREHLDWRLAQVSAYFDEVAPEEMPRDKVAEVLRASAGIRRWLDDLHEWAVREHLQGRPLPGLKLVKGRSRTVVSDRAGLEKAVEEALGEEGFERKVKGITALRRMLGERFSEVVEPYTRKTEEKLMLVDLSDKRPEASVTPDVVQQAMSEAMKQ